MPAAADVSQVRATAGLRLLPGAQAEEILEAVRDLLRSSYPFRFSEGQVSIMDGIDEGAYAWLTLNYLLGKLNDPPEHMVATIDQGGGSVQMAYAMSESMPAPLWRCRGDGAARDSSRLRLSSASLGAELPLALPPLLQPGRTPSGRPRGTFASCGLGPGPFTSTSIRTLATG